MDQRPPISSTTSLCAVIGDPIGHSLSPAIHNAAFAALGLDFVYTAFRVEDATAVFDGMRAMENFRGLSVTIPHKLTALESVDEASAVDRRIGAINTVLNEDGRLVGLGTDGPAALAALRAAGADPAGRRVLILGAGGAARAIAFTLLDRGGISELALLDVDGAYMQPLAADLEEAGDTPIRADPLTTEAVASRTAAADIVINCTPVGMHPRVEASLIPKEAFRPGLVVFDIVYNPLETRLLREAREAGCTVVHGVEMFVEQAVLQFESFTGADAPVLVMREVVLDRLRP